MPSNSSCSIKGLRVIYARLYVINQEKPLDTNVFFSKTSHLLLNFAFHYFAEGTQVQDKFKDIEHISKPTAQHNLFFQQPEKFKYSLLGINSHLQQSIEEGSVDLNKVWLSHYLKANTTEDNPDIAQVSVFFRVIRRMEKLNEEFKLKSNSDGQATHLVEQVIYGAEIICSMQKSVDWDRETKQSAEESIYLAAKTYFDRTKESNFTTNLKPPTDLEDVSCSVISNLKAIKLSKGSIKELCQKLRDVVSGSIKMRPVEFYLRPISEETQNQVLPKLSLEREFEIQFENERIFTMFNWIDDESYILLMSQPSLDRIPPFKTALDQFRDLLGPLRNYIQKRYSEIIHRANIEESIRSKAKEISNLLTDIIDWLIRRKKEIENITCLLSGTQLAMFDMKEIESRTMSNTAVCAKVFILKVDYKQDLLVESVQKTIGYSQFNFKFPAFAIGSTGEERLESISNMLQAFVYEARLGRWCLVHENSYQIGLVPMSSPLNDGDIRYVKYRAKELQEIDTNWLTIDPSSRAPSPLPSPPPISDQNYESSYAEIVDDMPLPPPPPESDMLPPPPLPPPPFTSIFTKESTGKGTNGATPDSAPFVPADHLRNLLFKDIRGGINHFK